MRSLKYTIPLALGIWWIPIASGIIDGFIASFTEKKITNSIISAALSSSIASAVYIFIAIKILVVPFLGNLLPFFAILFSAVDIGISLATAYFLSSRMIRTTIVGNSEVMEFYVNSQDEIEEKLRPFDNGCQQPVYSFSGENKVIVTRKCNGYQMKYEIMKEGKKYKVVLYLTADTM
ncbi:MULTISPECIES: hypothetical protein [Acidianus]|uniref:Uncharacterized protein n=1 Tax=Candidatus Acidianus copahuensis TaxID=1160895 RepID=A0A031LJD2_9CREN|nr:MULTISPECIES: hypothetical protein [Acidianus]EZQ02249.1 hypothetical protein CM19_10610 [Candidatus Acidianus copahuensis]NON61852.1 hypothetical protein [Acidianus sp. RZ1]